MTASMQAWSDRCTCRPGRDTDGSEFGPCPYCERASDQQSVARDAARWRLSQIRYPRLMDDPHGYFKVGTVGEDVSVGIQPHPVTKSTAINHCIMGQGKTEGEAIDGMILSLRAYAAEGHPLPRQIQYIIDAADEDRP